MKRQPVEITILGKTTELKGMRWPDDPGKRVLSQSIDQPCQLTVHLPGGKVLAMRTRPILVVSTITATDLVGSIDAPSEGEKAGSLFEKAAEIERLLGQWDIVPDQQLRARLEEWKRDKDPGTGFGGRMRIGMTIDPKAEVSFRVSSRGASEGGWHLVVEFDARAEEWERERHKAEELKL